MTSLKSKISVGGIWKWATVYKTNWREWNRSKRNNTLVNYDSPNGENLDDFMRLDASLNYNFNLSESIKASLTGVMNITNQDNDINRYTK
jgi:hypothetical protein